MNCQVACDPDCELGAVHCEWAHLPSHKPGWHSSDSCEEEQLRIELAEARRACKQFREELDRLRAAETCRVGQPAACGDFHTAGQCVREVHPLEREARDEAAKLRARRDQLLGERDQALELLDRLVGHEDDPCWLDHHGYCQAHGLSSPPCATAEARKLLGLAR